MNKKWKFEELSKELQTIVVKATVEVNGTKHLDKPNELQIPLLNIDPKDLKQDDNDVAKPRFANFRLSENENRYIFESFE